MNYYTTMDFGIFIYCLSYKEETTMPVLGEFIGE
tara:strand:+ start:5065 stop:5166 length:102 start_codon:yes stop_codon:yes gene_type:complete